MFLTAATTLAEMVPPERLEAGALYPSVSSLRQVSRAIAASVVAAVRDAPPGQHEGILREVDAAMWVAGYVAYRAV